MRGTDNIPENISRYHLPRMMDGIGGDTHTVTMAYDPKRLGVYIVCFDADGTSYYWWWDKRTGGFFPDDYDDDYGKPRTVVYLDSTDYTKSGLYVGTSSGVVGKFKETQYTDDTSSTSYAIDSYFTVGPIKIGENRQVKLSEIIFTLGTGTTEFKYWVYVHDSAEELMDVIVADSDGSDAMFSGTLTDKDGRIASIRTRAMGNSVGIKMGCSTSGTKFAIEEITLGLMPAGKVKNLGRS
jgi:hypothetical protein